MISRRHQISSQVVSITAPILIVLLALGLGLLAVLLAGKSPIDAVEAIYEGAFGNTRSISSTISRMVPMCLVALGWIIAFSTKRVSIGFEGQIIAGGAAAAYVGLTLNGLPTFVHLPLALLAAIFAGAFWVALPTFMWARRGVHEIITTLLMNLIALEMISWLVRGPLQEASGTFARTDPISANSTWPTIIDGTRLHWDALMVLVLIVTVAYLLKKTTLGLALRFVGANPVAACYQGLNSTRISVGALLASGGFAGLAGSSLILAQPTSTMSATFSGGYGYEGIVVALLARNNPYAVIPVAFLFATLRQGSGLLEAKVGVSSAIVTVIMGVIVIGVSVGVLLAEKFSKQQIAEAAK
jgi:general nucleoside transport system permease protein